MIYFSVPDFWEQAELISLLIYAIEEQPQFFYEDISISSTFGSFPCIWNGGRAVVGAYNKVQAIDILRFFNKYNISVRHTFTNRFLKDTDKYDHICNQICEITSQVGKEYGIQNGCTIYDEKLAEYISDKYPDLKIIYSTTKELKTIKDINKYSKNNLVIPSYNVNHDFRLLKQLKYPNNIELLCIETGCIKNCPSRIIHQDHVSSSVLLYESQYDEEEYCPVILKRKNWYDSYNNPDVFITIDEIRNKYLPLGFNQFKISGRGASNTNALNNIESYLHYFIKPEHKDRARLYLLEQLFSNRDILQVGSYRL